MMPIAAPERMSPNRGQFSVTRYGLTIALGGSGGRGAGPRPPRAPATLSCAATVPSRSHAAPATQTAIATLARIFRVMGLLPDRWMDVSRRQHVSRIGPHRQIIDPARHIVEAVINARRNDHDIARSDLPLLRGRLEGSLAARTNGDLHDLAIGRRRSGVDYFPAGEERASARDDVVHLGDVLVHDRADGSPRLRRGSPKHAHSDVVVSHVDGSDQSVCTR